MSVVVIAVCARLVRISGQLRLSVDKASAAQRFERGNGSTCMRFMSTAVAGIRLAGTRFQERDSEGEARRLPARRAFRRNGTVSTIRKRARINMLEHVLIGKVHTLCRNMLYLERHLIVEVTREA